MRHLARHLRWPALATCILLAGAYVASAFWCVAWLGSTHSVGIGRGVLWHNGPYVSGRGWPSGLALGRSIDAERSWNLELGGGLRVTMARQFRGRGETGLWLFLLPAAAATFFLFRTHARSRPAHLCRACNYDLRGTPATNGQVSCPECGSPHSPQVMS